MQTAAEDAKISQLLHYLYVVTLLCHVKEQYDQFATCESSKRNSVVGCKEKQKLVSAPWQRV
jgi:hypothetical protein